MVVCGHKAPSQPIGHNSSTSAQVNVDPLMHMTSDGMTKSNQKIKAITAQQKEAETLQKACQELCKEFLDLFKPQLGCLKD